MRSTMRVAAVSSLVCGLLAGCGGGGGGSSSPPPPPAANTTPPTATISAITPAQRVTNQAVSFTGAGTTMAGGTLTYSWTFGDGGTGTGASPTHNYTSHGNYTVTLRVTDAGGLFKEATQVITLVAPPTVPTLTIGTARTPNALISFTASATDPQGGAITYAWDFGDATTGAGETATHGYASAGLFQVRVTATNSLGLTAVATPPPLSIAWLGLTPPSLIVYNIGHFVGQTLFTGASFVEPNGLPYSLEWNFGDSATATADSISAIVHHTYAAAGTYNVRLTASSAAGQVVSATRTVTVQPPPSALAAVSDNVLQPYCAGAFCSAVNATTYSGQGVGIWRYHNATSAAATVNVALDGLHSGVATTMIFSNGRSTAAASAPGNGTAGKLTNRLAAATTESRLAQAHAAVQLENRRMAGSITRVPVAPRTGKQTRAVVQAAAPAVGTTRTWRESAFSGLTFNMQVAATCTFSTGRNGVIWVDADQLQSGELSPGSEQSLVATLCGADGAYERLIALLGEDLWGSAAAATPNYIQDTPALQDLHIVVPGVPQSSSWGGYFSSSNLVNPTADPSSNAALAVVLNGWVFAHYADDGGVTRNTLIHELKHLANYYQRAISRNAYHAAFLEETSAMLAEDLISGVTTPYSRTELRVAGYAFGGAGIGYIDWTHPQGGSYNLGGSFGAFLHRHYGSSLDRELISMCNDNGSPQSSYDCVNQYIVRHGGTSFEDDFARMGATTLGMMTGGQLPLGFGLPGMILDGIPLKPLGNYALESPFSEPPADLGGNFGATTQSFLRDYMDAGQTTFRRDNVVVPANSTLMVVVSDSPAF